MGSYTSRRTGLKAWIRDVRRLYDSHMGQVSGRVSFVLNKLKNVEREIGERYGFKLEDRDVLDIGAGQYLMQMHYFALCNRPVGIDFDVIAQGINPAPYVQMLWFNGFGRTLKTVGRKLLGVDRRYAAVVKDQLRVHSLPTLPVFHMDACHMTLSDGSFDFVYCYSVSHHLPDPGAAIDGIVRVLRPDGVVYVSLHLYTCETGSLDARALSGPRGDFPAWAHLRPKFAGDVKPNAYLNKLRIHDWRELFQKRMPGAHLTFNRTDRPGVEADAQALLDRGEISDYSLEELVTHEVVVLWKKA